MVKFHPYLFLLFPTLGVALAQSPQPIAGSVDTCRKHLASDNTQIRQESLFDIEKQPENASQLVPELTALLNDENDATKILAVACLAQAGTNAAPATDSLIALLDHQDYLFRAEVMEAIAKIGPVAEANLLRALQSNSPRIRAASLAVLNRTAVIDSQVLKQLQMDADSRVRIGVAQAWKKHGPVGVVHIVALTQNTEIEVTVGAIDALRYHFEDSAMAVKALVQCLSNPDAADSAAGALRTFGFEAQSAIPSIVAAYPFGNPATYNSSYLRAVAGDILLTIGPPQIADLDSLRDLLKNPNPNIRALAAHLIGQLGENAHAAATDLEELCLAEVSENVRIENQASTIQNEQDRDEFLINNDGHYEAALEACAAYWRVTRNTTRFVELVEQITVLSKTETIFRGSFFEAFDESPFEDFTQRDVEIALRLLESPHETVRNTFSYNAAELPPSVVTVELITKLWKKSNVRSSGSLELYSKLQIRGRENEVAQLLLTSYNQNIIELNLFADTVAAKKILAPGIAEVLEKGLDSQNLFERSSCLKALAALAEDKEKSQAVLISGAERHQDLQSYALESLLANELVGEKAIAFADRCLASSNLSAVRPAIMLLAMNGPKAMPSLPKIQKQLQDHRVGHTDAIALHVAIANTCIAGDKSNFQQLFTAAFAGNGENDELQRLQFPILISRLGAQRALFNDETFFMVQYAKEHRDSDRHLLPSLLDMLHRSGDPTSIAILTSLQNDRDWSVRRKAERILREIRSGDE